MTLQTATGTVTVNPAFLQEIKDSNPELWRLREQLHDCVRSEESRSVVACRLVQTLDDFRDALALQFALEEAYGFIEVPESLAMHEANDAKNQHCGLYLGICELCERAEELQYRGLVADQFAALVEEAQIFDARLDAHERLERRLIETAQPRR